MVNFVVKPEITFKTKVFIVAPTEDGKKTTVQIWGLFRVVKGSELNEIVRRIGEAQKNSQDVDVFDLQTLREALVGWEGLVNPDSSIFDFTDENRDLLLDIPYMRAAFIKAYIEAVDGQAKRGN